MCHGNWLKHIQGMGAFADGSTCRKCGQQEETTEHLLFDCDALEQVRVSLVWCRRAVVFSKRTWLVVLRFCRLMDLRAL